MFRAMFSPIIGSTLLYLQYLVVFTEAAAGWCLGWVDTAYFARGEGKEMKETEICWNTSSVKAFLTDRKFNPEKIF